MHITVNKFRQSLANVLGGLISLNQLWVSGLAIWIGYSYGTNFGSIIMGIIMGLIYAACFHVSDKAIYYGASFISNNLPDTLWIAPLTIRIMIPWLIAGLFLKWFF
jgi:hypothetical protein